jgi:hypothetical protein
LNHLKEEIHHKEQLINEVAIEIKKVRIDKTLEGPNFKIKIKALEEKFIKEICSDLPSAFWHRKKHVVTLPYISGFSEDKIPTKA